MTSIELFAGAGGLALGLEQAGFEHLLVNELMKDCCDTLRKNRPNWNVVHRDIRQVKFEEYAGKVDLVSGGFPCQSFSYAGKKLGFSDVRGTMFFEFARAIKEIQPKAFLGENVKGLLTHDKGATLETIKSILESFGYRVYYEVLDATRFSVPQRRQRTIIVGLRNDLGKDYHFPLGSDKLYTVRDALKAGSLYSTDCPVSDGKKYSERDQHFFQMIPEGKNWKVLPLDVLLQYTTYPKGGGNTGFLRRLAWDEPSTTLLTTPHQKMTARCHPAETRPLTVREYARIQTFPDDYEFFGTIESQYKQIGNAVPVNMAKAIGESIREVLEF